MNTAELVKQVLSEDPLARRDDVRLLLGVYQKCGMSFQARTSSRAKRLPRPATVLKARARLQNELGLYLPPPDVQAVRLSKSKRLKGHGPEEKLHEL